MNRPLRGLVLIYAGYFFGAGIGSARADSSVVMSREVRDYASTLGNFETKKNDGPPLAEVFFKGRAAAKSLLESDSAGQEPLLTLDDAGFHRAERLMRGFSLSRVEIVFVEPNADFFVALAKDRGDEEDKAFFSLYKETFAEGPAYRRQMTDSSACTRFGDMILVDLLKKWRTFAGKYPRRYSSESTQAISDMDGEFSQGTCACGEKGPVLKEYRAYVESFPAAPSIARVQERIKEMERGPTDMRFNCISG